MKFNSLYELIKQKNQEKGRPLKIICDWDDCLFSFQATVVYNFYNGEASFKEFFEEFWEQLTSEPNPRPNRTFAMSEMAKDDLKTAYENYLKLRKMRNEDSNKNADKYKKLHVVDSQQILSTAEDLLKCLKEDLVSELKIITTSYATNKLSAMDAKKTERFAKTFGRLPQCSFDIIRVQRVGNRNKPHRWEWIRDNYPDFDIFIDDRDWWIISVKENFPKDKIYVINDYNYCRNTTENNIHHVKTTVSELKDEDFKEVAQEYKVKKEKESTTVRQTDLSERERERESIWKQPVFYWGLVAGMGASLLGIGICWMISKKKFK